MKPRWFVFLSIPLLLAVIALAFFAVRTQGFGYFITPSPTLTSTSTFAFYAANQKSSSTVTPFQPLPTDTPTPTATATATPTNTPTPTVTPTPRPTSTPLPTSTSKPAATQAPSDGLPAAYQISGVVGHAQSMPLSCESRVAADWAAFYGVNISESSFQSALPVSDNPDKGFVGSVYGLWGQIPPNDYGVHASPVAALLREYGLSANANKGVSLSTLKQQISSGHPVIVWVVGNVWTSAPVSYTASDGSTTTVAYYEHAVILTGYDETGFTFVDGDYTYWRSAEAFASSFTALGSMAITH